ncbi:head protein [Cystobacter fuscus]|nr:head protein [Cystobacter fuscus]
MRPGELSLEALELLGRRWEEASSPEEKERLLLAMDALRFVSATGQTYDLEDYRKSLEAQAPPLVVATFDTREAADDWLKASPRPPYHAYVLIAGEYHIVMYIPEMNHRRLISHPVLEFYLADMIREGLPAPVATFKTHEEAQAWIDHQPEPPRQVFITIAGDYYLAVYHHRVNLRAMYPISMAAKSEKNDLAEN